MLMIHGRIEIIDNKKSILITKNRKTRGYLYVQKKKKKKKEKKGNGVVSSIWKMSFLQVATTRYSL